ncbi:aspartate--ammonia ligase [bacterium]|nr:MAG: aspartate--ammonia ligase [bacterium]
MSDKRADLAGPGISTYPEVEKILPGDYHSILNKKDTQKAIYAVKDYIEKNLCKELNLMMVQVPLIVTKESGLNDNLDRDGSRTPVDFPCGLGISPRLNAQVVQAATKWKRPALKQFECSVGEGICTDMRAVRKDYFLDHDHSSYVDQWDWERVMVEKDRNLAFLKDIVKKIWKVIVGAEEHVQEMYPQLKTPKFPNLPKELEFFHAEEILEMFPELPRKQRETQILQKHPAIFIVGIGSVLKDGYPHEMRAADYDDWVTNTSKETGKETYGLNGDILVWNHLTKRRHELTSMGIRVTKETLVKQLEIANLMENLKLPYHQQIMKDQIPLSVGGGIGQGRVQMHLLRKAHIGEVTVTVWPDELKRICKEKNIIVLE